MATAALVVLPFVPVSGCGEEGAALEGQQELKEAVDGARGEARQARREIRRLREKKRRAERRAERAQRSSPAITSGGGGDGRASAPAAGLIEVPDVVGLDHQLAQDTMQAAGLYNLSEEDATGEGRLLLFDRNWTVVEQSPAAGEHVSEDATIVLRAKKDDE